MTDLDKWGKDHWSLLAYVETCCVDCTRLEHNRMRCNENRHPLLKGAAACNMKWENIWSTRLKEGIIQEHDDWDCLNDLEEAGFIEIISMVNGIVEITKKGAEVAHQIRKHKTAGGVFKTFKMEI